VSLTPTAVTISNGTALSPQVNLGNKLLVGFSMPAAWTAAALTFQVSYDGGTTFQDLYNSGGTEVSFTVAANHFVALDPTLWRGINCIKVRSGTGSVPVNQGQDSTLTLITS